jgi:hypothetical protein
MSTLLSSQMRDVLIDHLDGAEVPIVRVSELKGFRGAAGGDRLRTTQALLARGLLKTNGARSTAFAVQHHQKAPTHTTITEAGRRELCALLGEYADAILRARFEVPPSGDGADLARWQDRHRREAAYFPVDIPAGSAHLGMDNFTHATEGAADGDAAAEARDEG